MAAANFAEALSRVLAHEGGYTNHPSDPGGPTNWGITIYDARRYWKRGARAADVKVMPREVAVAIYKTKYWDALRGDDLPSGVDYAVFDYGVNSGVGRAAKVLRRALAMPDRGGVVTDEVVAAARRTESKSLIQAICGERLAFLRSLKTWDVFGAGWGRRVVNVRAAALAMAASSQPCEISIGENAADRGKAVVADHSSARAATIGGTLAAGAASAVAASDRVTAAVAIVATVLAVVAIVLLWRWWRRRREEAAVIPS
jgi:lysozyme family protein